MGLIAKTLDFREFRSESGEIASLGLSARITRAGERAY